MLTRQPTLDLADLERPALEAALEARGHPRFHAGQIFRWIYGRGVVDPSAMTDLSRELRAMLAEACTISTPAIVQREKSIDGTEKFLLRLADGRLVESVFIPDTPSMTFCISTQVGCAMACAFCLTGKMGLVRNLSTAEIVGQVRVLADALHLRDARFNIVLMGMGEPLHNYDETMKALRILADEQGFAMSPRRITLSTVGILPALEKLAREPVMPNLAISLHAPTDVQRGPLVPINRKYGVADIVDLVATCESFAPHFHLPLEHASDRVLAAMRRPYTIDQYASLVDRIRVQIPDVSIGSDVIVGFPGETDEDFGELARYLERSPLTHLHVFPYSDRPGTAASLMEGKVHGAVIRERAQRVREIGRSLSEHFHDRQIGTTHRGLTLDDGSLVVTENYMKLRIAAAQPRNAWVRVRVTSHHDGELLAG